jgi:urease gamma subunit
MEARALISSATPVDESRRLKSAKLGKAERMSVMFCCGSDSARAGRRKKQLLQQRWQLQQMEQKQRKTKKLEQEEEEEDMAMKKENTEQNRGMGRRSLCFLSLLSLCGAGGRRRRRHGDEEGKTQNRTEEWEEDLA